MRTTFEVAGTLELNFIQGYITWVWLLQEVRIEFGLRDVEKSLTLWQLYLRSEPGRAGGGTNGSALVSHFG